MAIAWYLGNERVANFESVGSTDGHQWTIVYDGESSGKTIYPETYRFEQVRVNYVRIINHRNTMNNWNSITEVMFR